MNKNLFNNTKFTQQKLLNEKTHTNFGFNSNTDIMSALGKSFALIRINKGMKQEDIVSMTGLSISTVRRFEAGHTIALNSFIKLMRAIGRITDIDFILNIKNQSNHFNYDRIRS